MLSFYKIMKQYFSLAFAVLIVSASIAPVHVLASSGHNHHHAMFDVIMSHTDATHVAVKSGDWSNASTWANGARPSGGANVLIRAGLSVVYDIDSDVELGNVRVDGTLKWSQAKSTKMVLDTLLTTPESTLEIGNEASPMPANKSATIVFVDGLINQARDTELLSRGLVAFGEVDIQGAAKSVSRVLAQYAVAGDTQLILSQAANGWQVGDSITVLGTSVNSDDEARTITAINGTTINLNRALTENHTVPLGFNFDTYVINTSRNVRFLSANPNGVRGHVMLHDATPDQDGRANMVRYAEFTDLGRTNRLAEITASNPIGRYPLHLHKTGTSLGSAVSVFEGNSVNGSPGWGMVQHESNALFIGNTIQQVTGAGMVSETGNEMGAWRDNVVTSISGRTDAEVLGAEGAAYDNQSRVIIQQNNIASKSTIGWNFSGKEEFMLDGAPAASTVNGKHRKMFEREQLKFDPSPFDVAIDHEEPPIEDFSNNTVIASDLAFRVFHRQYSDDTDTKSVIRNLTVWGGRSAIGLDNYASNYLFIDSVFQGSSTGFRIERKTSAAVFTNVQFHGFGTAYQSYGVNHEVMLVNTQFNNVGKVYDLKPLFRSDVTAAVKQPIIDYFRDEHGINYTNPAPKVINNPSLTGVTLNLSQSVDLNIGPSDRGVRIDGIIVDSLGTRHFNDYVIAKPPSGNGTSKDFRGIDVSFLSSVPQTGRQKDFTVPEFLDVHGTYQKENGRWVSPTVHWITERLTGVQHPIVIDISLTGFSTAVLESRRLDTYPNPGVGNPSFSFGFDLETGKLTDGVNPSPPVQPPLPPVSPSNPNQQNVVIPPLIFLLLDDQEN